MKNQLYVLPSENFWLKIENLWRAHNQNQLPMMYTVYCVAYVYIFSISMLTKAIYMDMEL